MDLELLKETTKYFENNKTEIEEVLKVFYFILNNRKELLKKAILLLDDNEIIKIQNQLNGRSFWIIKGIDYRNYKVLKSYCPCQDYFDQLQHIGKKEACCKHLIAISLGTSLHKFETRCLNNEDFVKMMLEGVL